MKTLSKRYSFIDLVRIIACLAIIIYHFLNTLAAYGIRQCESIQFLYKTKNMNMATVAVGLFFMISGSGLMLSSDSKESFSVSDFFKRRIIKIFIPYYVSYVLYVLIQLIVFKNSFSNLFGGIPLYSSVFTVLGIDGYLSQYGIKTFYLGIGEWFIFPLLVMYLLFPVLRKLIKKNRVMAFCVMTAFFLLVSLLYDKIPFMNLIPCYTNVFVKIYEFFLGMLLITFLDRIPHWICLVVSTPVIYFYLTCAHYLQDNEAIRILIQNVAFFLFFAGFEILFKKMPRTFKLVATVSSFTYPAFLIHHNIELLAIPLLSVFISYEKNSSLLVLFAVMLIIIAIAAIIISFISNKLSKIKFKRK